MKYVIINNDLILSNFEKLPTIVHVVCVGYLTEFVRRLLFYVGPTKKAFWWSVILFSPNLNKFIKLKELNKNI